VNFKYLETSPKKIKIKFIKKLRKEKKHLLPFGAASSVFLFAFQKYKD
jgi:hypothetical protein